MFIDFLYILQEWNIKILSKVSKLHQIDQIPSVLTSNAAPEKVCARIMGLGLICVIPVIPVIPASAV